MRRLEEVVSAEDAAWLHAFSRDVKAALPGEVEAVILFGSRARGDAEPDSDYDVAVVVKDGLERDKRTDRVFAEQERKHYDERRDLAPIRLAAGRLYPPASELAMRIELEGIVQ